MPGAGQYCPHIPAAKERFNKTDYKFWVGKHKEEKKKEMDKSGALPSPASLSPMNHTLTTFDRIESDLKKPIKVKHFGLDSRFEYTRTNKKKIVEKRPDPSSYNTMM